MYPLSTLYTSLSLELDWQYKCSVPEKLEQTVKALSSPVVAAVIFHGRVRWGCGSSTADKRRLNRPALPGKTPPPCGGGRKRRTMAVLSSLMESMKLPVQDALTPANSSISDRLLHLLAVKQRYWASGPSFLLLPYNQQRFQYIW